MLLNQSFKVLPKAGTIYGLAGSTTPVIFKVPAAWLGKVVMVQGEGCQVYMVCTNEPDPTALNGPTAGTAGTVASNVLTPGNTIPLVAGNGASEPVLIPDDSTYIKVVNEAAAGRWTMYLSDSGRAS
jgi:hypothetical protein